MNTMALINRKSVNSALPLKQAQRQERRMRGKGSRRPLKNYLGKVVTLAAADPVLEKSRISNFAANVTMEELLCAIENAGLTGMSGNGFPTLKKITGFLAAKASEKILLINAVECDPALLHDEWLLHNRYEEIQNTVRCMMQAFSLTRVVLATKDKSVVQNDAFTVAVVPPRYPMGEEHFLIRQALGIPIDREAVPAERGILVLNVQSVYQIGKIINHCYDGGRFITVADLSNALAKIVYVYPTDNISQLVASHLGGKNNKVLYKGFGAMSCTKAGEEDGFTGHENFAAYANAPRIDNTNRCRHCGNCARKCPMDIKAAKIVQAVDNNKSFDSAPYHPERCIQCGSCTYFCPASKDVAEYME